PPLIAAGAGAGGNLRHAVLFICVLLRPLGQAIKRYQSVLARTRKTSQKKILNSQFPIPIRSDSGGGLALPSDGNWELGIRNSLTLRFLKALSFVVLSQLVGML